VLPGESPFGAGPRAAAAVVTRSGAATSRCSRRTASVPVNSNQGDANSGVRMR
jgi:hypothetical protein